MKVLLIGNARHGKDTVAEILRDKYGLSFGSSSMTCAGEIAMPYLENLGITYDSVGECYEDRVNHRAHWFDAITAYNTPDKARLGRLIFERNDIYVGIRNKREFWAVKSAGLYDVCVWVDACERLPLEPATSMQLRPWMADYVVDNNGPQEELEGNVTRLFDRLIPPVVTTWQWNIGERPATMLLGSTTGNPPMATRLFDVNTAGKRYATEDGPFVASLSSDELRCACASCIRRQSL